MYMMKEYIAPEAEVISFTAGNSLCALNNPGWMTLGGEATLLEADALSQPNGPIELPDDPF